LKEQRSHVYGFIGMRRSGIGAGARSIFPSVGLAALLCLSSCVTRRVPELNRFEFTQPQMGVPFRMVLYAANQAAADSAAFAAFARIAQLNEIMSDYEMDSELSQLSRTAGQGKAVKVSADLWKVLQRAQHLAWQTDGAFDVTVGPYTSLWRKARREKRLPSSSLLAEARTAVGYQKLQLDSKQRTAKLLASRMRLDLGGIAKGYAVDEALKVLGKHGIKIALVAGSGDMAMSDPPPGTKGWRIEVAPLDVTNARPKRFVLLSNAAIATSGDIFQRLEIDGRRYSHIVDPHTGVGLTDHSLVTVIAKDCLTADSLATAVSVLGPSRGLKLIGQTSGTAAHIVRSSGQAIEEVESDNFATFYERAARRTTRHDLRGWSPSFNLSWKRRSPKAGHQQTG
jgi:thiamine biosynthesis lipoprotein